MTPSRSGTDQGAVAAPVARHVADLDRIAADAEAGGFDIENGRNIGHRLNCLRHARWNRARPVRGIVEMADACMIPRRGAEETKTSELTKDRRGMDVRPG